MESVELLSTSLLKGTRVLVQDGMDRLRRNWDCLPQVKARLWQEGTDLEAALEANSDRARPAVIAALTVQGCGWYIEVRLLRGDDIDGRDPSPRQAAALADIREEVMTDDAVPPRGDPPDNRQLANAMLKLVDMVENIDEGQVKLEAKVDAGFADIRADLAELRGDTAGLKAGQAELREDVAALKGRVGNLIGEQYEQLFRDRMPDLIHKACRLVNLPHPQVELLWTDRIPGAIVGWEARCEALGIEDPDTELPYCDFLYRLRWKADRNPDLLLAGETSITVVDRVLDKVERHQKDLENTGHQARTLLVGADFTPQVMERGGAAAVEAAGAQWLKRSEDLNAPVWLDSTEIADMLKTWYDGMGSSPGS